MAKANHSTLQHTIYNIHQQSATQGSNDMAHTLSCRIAATTRFRTEGRLPERDGAKFLPTIRSGRPGSHRASIHQMAPPK